MEFYTLYMGLAQYKHNWYNSGHNCTNNKDLIGMISGDMIGIYWVCSWFMISWLMVSSSFKSVFKIPVGWQLLVVILANIMGMITID